MARKGSDDLVDGLAELFDMADFAMLLKAAAPSTRLSAYLQIIKLLLVKSKDTSGVSGEEEMKKKINKLFNIDD